MPAVVTSTPMLNVLLPMTVRLASIVPAVAGSMSTAIAFGATWARAEFAIVATSARRPRSAENDAKMRSQLRDRDTMSPPLCESLSDLRQGVQSRRPCSRSMRPGPTTV